MDDFNAEVSADRVGNVAGNFGLGNRHETKSISFVSTGASGIASKSLKS